MVLAVASVFLGSNNIPFSEVLGIILNGPAAGDDAQTHSVIWDLRVPRTLLALIVGAALAVAGAVAQSWTRNPLADPGIIGVNAGASFVVALALTLGAAQSVAERAVWGIIGAAVASAIVLAISQVSRGTFTLVLVGVGVTFALQSATHLLSLYSSDTLEGLRRWIVGSTAGRTLTDVGWAAVGCAVGLALAAYVARSLDIVAMGEDAARALGATPERVYALAAVIVIVLAGTATAMVGLITFLGFAVPHLVRHWTGPSLSAMLVPTALVGAVAALLADIIGRFVMQPNELEMAIVLAIIGAPLMISAARSKRGVLKGEVAV